MAAQTPPEASVSVVPPTSATSAPDATPGSSLPLSSSFPRENSTNFPTVSNTENSGLGLASKRQRRPSVRLGEIGHHSIDNTRTDQSRRPKAYRFHKDPSFAAKTSKSRPLTNLVNGGDASNGNQYDENKFTCNLWGRKPTTKKSTKKAKTNWGSSVMKYEASNGGWIDENDAALRSENHENNDPEVDVSGSPMKELSPVQSEDNQNMGLQFWDRRAMRARVSRSESLDRQDNNHINNNRNNATNGIQDINSGDENPSSSGVGDWLHSLGLGRYAPIFEIHEVDDEVLPMLTLEDLKDMGINAVGSKRKMYAGILKLREGFS